MKKNKIKVEKVHHHYTANGVPLDYCYWTEEAEDPCPECGSRLRFVKDIMDADYYCASCNKYLDPRCECGDCNSEFRGNRPIMLPEFRQKISPLEKQKNAELEYIQNWADDSWVSKLMDQIEILEQLKYLDPTNERLIDRQALIINEVISHLEQGEFELFAILSFKAALTIVQSQTEIESAKVMYSDFITQLDNLVSDNIFSDESRMSRYSFANFYENIVDFYYPDELVDQNDRFDSLYSAKEEERRKDLNQSLEEHWSSEMKEIRSKISKILDEGGEVAELLEAHISLSDVDGFINHLLEQQKKLDSEIFRYEMMNGDPEE